jgi:peptidyl-prolyl cis-trans isomerase SurA
MKRLALSIAVFALAFGAFAGASVIDRIAAIVNDEIILLSEIDEKVFLLQAQGQLQGADSVQVEAVRRDVLDRLIEERLVVQRAMSQGLSVDAAELIEAVDEAIGRVKGQFPDDASFQKALETEGITLVQLRERYENDVRQEKLAQRIVSREIRSKVTVTTDEVQKYFEENKETLPKRPDEARLAHLVVEPVDPAEARRAQEEIDAALAALRSGESFEDVVARHTGGRLGTFCRGDLSPEVEAVLDTLLPGDYSVPTRTLQGFHIFQIVEENEAGCLTLRHVLEPIAMSKEDVDRAQTEAEEARKRVQAGEQFPMVVAEVSDDQLTRETGGDLGWTPLQNLLPEVAAELDTLEIGAVSSVIRSDRGFHVFKILERREGGDYPFVQIQERLRQFLEAQKLETAYDKWLEAVRDSAYVEVKAWSRS